MLGSIGSERYVQYAQDIHDSGTLLLSIINDILDLSKIEAGNFTIEPQRLDMSHVVASCLRLVGGRTQRANPRLAADGPKSSQPVYADERGLTGRKRDV